MENGAAGGSDAVEMGTDTPVITADDISDPVMEDSSMAVPTTAADLDSQPLNELGVSVIDQDVLERNVAAQV
jgi:hypothetical protein